MPLLTSTLVILFAVAKVGGGGITLAAGAPGGSHASALPSDVTVEAVGGGVGAGSGGGAASPELAALAEGGAWGAVYDALKGPCMARATELQQANATGGGGKKGGGDGAEAVSADLTVCLDNMARCAEVKCAHSCAAQGCPLVEALLRVENDRNLRLYRTWKGSSGQRGPPTTGEIRKHGEMKVSRAFHHPVFTLPTSSSTWFRAGPAGDGHDGRGSGRRGGLRSRRRRHELDPRHEGAS